MANSLFESLHRFEVIAFFSGYPMMYSIFRSFIPQRIEKMRSWSRLSLLWPVAYGLLGALYLGLQCKNLLLDGSGSHPGLSPLNRFLTAWGASAILFWTPALVRKPYLSLLHSLPFFALITWDLIGQVSAPGRNGDLLGNDMQLYGVSLLLAAGAFLIVALGDFAFIRRKRGSGACQSNRGQ